MSNISTANVGHTSLTATKDLHTELYKITKTKLLIKLFSHIRWFISVHLKEKSKNIWIINCLKTTFCMMRVPCTREHYGTGSHCGVDYVFVCQQLLLLLLLYFNPSRIYSTYCGIRYLSPESTLMCVFVILSIDVIQETVKDCISIMEML